MHGRTAQVLKKSSAGAPSLDKFRVAASYTDVIFDGLRLLFNAVVAFNKRKARSYHYRNLVLCSGDTRFLRTHQPGSRSQHILIPPLAYLFRISRTAAPRTIDRLTVGRNRANYPVHLPSSVARHNSNNRIINYPPPGRIHLSISPCIEPILCAPPGRPPLPKFKTHPRRHRPQSLVAFSKALSVSYTPSSALLLFHAFYLYLFFFYSLSSLDVSNS